MYSIRIATGNSNLPISSQHFRRRFSALKSSGVGLSSSAESTAHPSYRDIKSESQETEVRRHQVGQIRAHPSAAWTTGAGPSQPSLPPRTSAVHRGTANDIVFSIDADSVPACATDGSRVGPRRQHVPSSLMANVLDRNRQGKFGIPIYGRHFGRGASALQSSGVGLSSSAESTSHLSNRDIGSESEEMEV
ncbi:hypothetical protein Mal15_61650 [Stieleria maiorica]|uniref:Uncharacterized protein n=1 Tax=Stieleria maiorica TaxID=2795974 RepID=A0A5B9ML69_9BACT|nr:hypothetical protein Mal15_61650 [Stieleria maiorica]